MSWDWKKALGVGEGKTGAALSSGVGSGRSCGCKKGETAPQSGERVRSIAWRPAGLGGLSSASGTGCGVPLVEDRDHDCPFCRGRGELPGGSVCPICSGGKKVHVEPPSVRCAFCGGGGQMPPRSNLSCWVCKGRGLVPVTTPVQVCPDCQGRGRKPCESLYCAKCRGVGAVPFTFDV
jgi:DnaJ-class molecular chaperone